MRHKNRKYIVYINADYMAKLFIEACAYSHEEQMNIRRNMMKEIRSFIRGENASVLYVDQFRDVSGKMIHAFDIVPLPSCNMRHIRHQSSNKRII